jgi:ABC-type sugar transport system permease subunit
VTITAELPSAGLPSAGLPPAGRRRARRRRESLTGYLFILPPLALFSVFTFYPFLHNFKAALYQTPPYPNEPSRYVGLHQVGQVLSSTQFLQSLTSTVLFSLIVVPSGLVIGLLLAVAAHRKLKGIGVYRTIFSSTVVTSVAIAAVIFGTIMDPVVGLLPWLGITTSPPLLENPTWALFAVALVTIWQGLGLSFIIMSAGLQSVPDDVLEAAELDGASPASRFWHVTVPLLSPILFFALVIGTISAFQSFGQIDLLTGGNSAYLHTDVLTYYIFQNIQGQAPNTGVASVLSIVLFAMTLTLTLVQLHFVERRVHYAG